MARGRRAGAQAPSRGGANLRPRSPCRARDRTGDELSRGTRFSVSARDSRERGSLLFRTLERHLQLNVAPCSSMRLNAAHCDTMQHNAATSWSHFLPLRGSTRLNVAQCSTMRPLHGTISCHSAAQRGSMRPECAGRSGPDPSLTPPGDLLPNERLPTASLPALDAGWAGQPPAPPPHPTRRGSNQEGSPSQETPNNPGIPQRGPDPPANQQQQRRGVEPEGGREGQTARGREGIESIERG